MKILARFFAVVCLSVSAIAQQPQAAEPNPEAIVKGNYQFTNGVAPGYWVYHYGTASLVVHVGKGTCFDSSEARHAYAGGTLTMTASATNYIYLATSSCTLSQNTSGYPVTGALPLATVVATSSVTSITDDRTWFNGLTGGQCPLSAGVNAKTSGYTLDSTDAGKLVTFSGSSLTATLPASPPSANWCARIQNLNASSLTVSRNSLLINGGSSNLTLAQYQTVTCVTDNSNYFCTRPIVAGSNVTITESSNQESIASSTLSTPVSVANGGTGLGTLTAHAVLLGEGTSNVAFAPVVGTGKCLMDNGLSSDPTFQTCGGGSSASTIQSNSLKGNTVTTGSITSGHLVVVGIDSDNGSVDPPVLSSTRVPSWTLACKSVANSNKAWLFYGIATSSGTDSISSTVAGSFSGTSYLEVSGANAIKDACNAVYSNVAGISSTFSTTFLNDVVVSFWAGWHVGECVTAVSPMVIQSSNCAAPADPLAIGSFTTTSAGSQTAAFNSTGGLDDNQVMLTAAFTSSNSAVGVAPYYQTDQANGSALSQELINDFISGTGITVSGADDSANTRSKFTFDLANTAVSAGTYGDATHSLTATVNAQGQLTAISTNTIPGAGTATYAQLCSGTISSSTATLQFDTTHNCSGAHPFTSTYNYYDIRCDHITPTSGSNTFFVFRVATVGGYDSGGNYGYSVVQANGATNFNNQFGGDSAQTSIALTGAMTSTNNGGSGELQVNNPLSSTTFKFFNSNFGTFDQGGHWYVNPGSGRYLSNTALQDIEFLFTTGNIATATCTIWGRP